jgi:hypothetical protein
MSEPTAPSPSTDLDLRPLLARGVDPLYTAVQHAGPIPRGGSFALHAPFDPMPLRRVLARMGFSSSSRQVAERHWQVSLVRDGKGLVLESETEAGCAGLAVPDERLWREGAALHVDVRGMAPPLPMLTILRVIAMASPADELIVHHDRDPLYLYPELAELGWSIEHLPGEVGEVKFRLRQEV